MIGASGLVKFSRLPEKGVEYKTEPSSGLSSGFSSQAQGKRSELVEGNRILPGSWCTNGAALGTRFPLAGAPARYWQNRPGVRFSCGTGSLAEGSSSCLPGRAFTTQSSRSDPGFGPLAYRRLRSVPAPLAPTHGASVFAAATHTETIANCSSVEPAT